jgi:hypothetical protein
VKYTSPSCIRLITLLSASDDPLAEFIRSVHAPAAPPAIKDQADWCYGMVTGDYPPVDPYVREVYDGIEALSNQRGSELLCKLGAQFGLNVLEDLGHVSHVDLAMLARLRRPKLFELACEKIGLVARKEKYLLFVGPSEERITLRSVTGRRQLLEERVRVWLAAQGRPTVCHLHFTEFSPHVVIDIVTHGVPGPISTPLGRFVPDGALRDATIILDTRQRFAAIRVGCVEEESFYVDLAALAGAGAVRTYWRGAPILIDSILDPARLAELEVPVPGLERARLQRVKLGLESGGQLDLRKTDLEKSAGGSCFSLNGLAQLSFELQPTGFPFACAVAVAPPNAVWFDRRFGAVSLHYLQDRQLLRV